MEGRFRHLDFGRQAGVGWALIARKSHAATSGGCHKTAFFLDPTTVWVHQSTLENALIPQSSCKYHDGSATGAARGFQMHNPHDPSGSIRADKVGAFRVFRVLFGGVYQVRSLFCRQA